MLKPYTKAQNFLVNGYYVEAAQIMLENNLDYVMHDSCEFILVSNMLTDAIDLEVLDGEEYHFVRNIL